jgi:NADH:ubiquinone reductase (non-electrogenic)
VAVARRQAPRFAVTAVRHPRIIQSILTRSLATPASQVPPPPPPPSGPRPDVESTTGAAPVIVSKPISRWRSFLQTLGRVTLITLITSTGVFIYTTQKERHPGEQKPFDSEKKTIVILGSGWGATSMLKVSTVSCAYRQAS